MTWKDIEGYNGKYQISDTGAVRSFMKGKSIIMKQRRDKDGYMLISLYKDKKPKTYKVHRLVAQHFLPNIENYPQINHINEKKDDNHASNLEWCDCKYNINYGNHNTRCAESLRGKKHTAERIEKIRANAPGSKKVIMLTPDKERIREFRSASEAARYLNGSATNVTAVIRGRSKTYKGYIFAYSE